MATNMKYSLSNLLLLTALIAALMGWLYDHRRLANDKERLNAQATELFSRYVAANEGSGRVIWPGDRLPPTRSYNSSIEEDRSAYLNDHLSPFSGPALLDVSKNASNDKN
jgi:hypothetical protein